MTDYVKKWSIHASDNIAGQFIRYTFVGGGAALIDVSLYGIGVNLLGVNHMLANAVSFTAGLAFNYSLSRRWVFKKTSGHGGRDFLLFALIGLIGLLLSSLLLFLLINCRILFYVLASDDESMVKPAAKILTVAAVFLWNFFARKKLVFDTQGNKYNRKEG